MYPASKMAPRAPALFAAVLMTALTACNNPQPLETSQTWIEDPASSSPQPRSSVTPTPTPTVTATPTPSATPTPTSSPAALYSGPPELAKYVQKFVDDAKAQGVDVLSDLKNPTLSLQIAKLDSYGSSVIGLCETGGGLRRVTLDPDFWNSVSETQRELLAHHELGHCVLYRPHRSTVLSSGLYASIMYPIIMSSSSYLNNYDYYQEELFTQTAQAVQATQVSVASDGVTRHICDFDEI